MDPNVCSCFNWKNVNTKVWAPPRLEAGPMHCCVSAPRIILASGMISKWICKKVNCISYSPWGRKESDAAEWAHTRTDYMCAFCRPRSEVVQFESVTQTHPSVCKRCLSVVCEQKTSNPVRGCVMFSHQTSSAYDFIHLSFCLHCSSKLEQVDNNLKSLSKASW